MSERRYPRDRRGESRGGKKSARSRPRAGAERPCVLHRLYGAIPLVTEEHTDATGKVCRSQHYDLVYAPPLPPRAVRGNVRLQSYCPLCHVPKYFYVDEERDCVQCGAAFVFLATEQKYWYESL